MEVPDNVEMEYSNVTEYQEMDGSNFQMLQFSNENKEINQVSVQDFETSNDIPFSTAAVSMSNNIDNIFLC